MSTSVEKFRVIIEIDGVRYVIKREFKFDEPTYARLTDRGPADVLAKEQFALLQSIAKTFDAAASTVGSR